MVGGLGSFRGWSCSDMTTSKGVILIKISVGWEVEGLGWIEDIGLWDGSCTTWEICYEWLLKLIRTKSS